MPNSEARQIFQTFLDATGDALLSGDAETFFSHLKFPHVLISEDSEMVAETPDDLMPRFISLHNALKVNAVTHYVRVVRAARFKSETEICGDWNAHIIRNGHRLVPAYPARARIVLEGDRWLCSHGVQGVRFPLLPDRFPEVAEEPYLRDIFIMD